MSRFVTVAERDAVTPGMGHRVIFEDKEIALFRVGEEIFAIDNECPHYGAQLCHGSLHNNSVACPWHWWQFSLTDGKCLTVPGMDVKSYPVRVEGNEIQVDVGD